MVAARREQGPVLSAEHRGTPRRDARQAPRSTGFWALEFGNAAPNGDPQTLFFTAGIQDEAHGLFGTS